MAERPGRGAREGADRCFGHLDVAVRPLAYHREIATLVLLAAGLLAGGPDGARPHRLSPLTR